jgi:hypothetical protein
MPHLLLAIFAVVGVTSVVLPTLFTCQDARACRNRVRLRVSFCCVGRPCVPAVLCAEISLEAPVH